MTEEHRSTTTHPTLREVFDAHRGKTTDKWSLYLGEYQRWFQEFRDQPVRILEIGIQNGGSLEVWRDYFPNIECIVGCDIDPKCASLTYDDSRIHVIVGDACSPEVAKEIFAISPEFDVIIDDGSHESGDIIRTFLRYFPALRMSGLFIAEDLHCSYYPSFNGGLFDNTSSLSFFKDLVDIVNEEHWGVPVSPNALLKRFSERYRLDQIFANDGLFAWREIHSIEFVNSLSMVRKSASSLNGLGSRQIRGGQALVEIEPLPLDGTTMPRHIIDDSDFRSLTHPADQLSFWQDHTEALNEELDRVNAELDRINAELRFSHKERRQTDALVERLRALVIAERSASARRLEQIRTAHAAANARAVQIEHDAAHVRHDLQAIRSSTIWRMTYPIRWSGTRLYQMRNIGRAFLLYAHLRGGTLPALRSIIGRIRNQGVARVFRAALMQRFAAITKPVANLSGEQDRYADWIEWQKQHDRALQERQTEAYVASAPLISVLMPVYDPPAAMLRKAIDSVIAQSYPKWEFCIADDCSPNPAVRGILAEYAARDPRIKVVYRDNNGHISEASNSALALATGRWCALLDHDDELHPMALAYVADADLKNPHATIIFSDEDKIDESGRRFAPLFKGGFNIDLLLGQNSISHLGAYRTSTLRDIGGFRKGFEGSQDWDLALRVIERSSLGDVIHVPVVLYHWRFHEGSTSTGAEAKPYARDAGIRAVDEFIQKLSPGAVTSVNPFFDGFLRVQFPVPDPAPSVEILIPTRDRLELLRRCIDSVQLFTAYPNYRICIIDNGSVDPETIAYLDDLCEQPDVRVMRSPGEFNFSRLNNEAAASSTTDYLCLLNNDIEVTSSTWLAEMISQAVRPGVGCVGARLWYPDGTVQHGGIVLGLGGLAAEAHKHFPQGHPGYFGWLCLSRQMSAVTAACLVVSRQLWNTVNGMDEDLAVAYNDVDLCLRVAAFGYRTIWTPFADLIHGESKSRGADGLPNINDRLARESLLMRSRWDKSIRRDPMYSPNLTRSQGNYSIASTIELNHTYNIIF